MSSHCDSEDMASFFVLSARNWKCVCVKDNALA